MDEMELLKGKRIIAVDDEPDILETLEEILDMCSLDTAMNFEDALGLIDKNVYDAAILDVMGVNGFELLQEAQKRNLTAVILTAHALTMENLVKFMRAGAQSFLPKEKLAEIGYFLFSALSLEAEPVVRRPEEENKEKAASEIRNDSATEKPVERGWLSRLKSYYDKKFGSGWLDDYETGAG